MRRGIALLALGVALSAATGISAASLPRPALVPNAVAFRDRLHGVIGTGFRYCPSRGCRTAGTVSLTSDGGRTWHVVLRTGRPVVAIGYDGPAVTARLDDGLNLRSGDRGRHWHPWVAPGPALGPCPAEMLPHIDGTWALCTGEGGAGSMAKSVYRFTSTGARRVAYTPFDGHGGYGGISGFGYPLGIAGGSGGFGLIWESRGTLYVTNDGGHHWVGKPGVAVPELDFGLGAVVLGRAVGFVLLQRGSFAERLLETTDAGRTWRVVHRWG